MAAPEPIESDHPSASQMMKLESELSEIKAMLAQQQRSQLQQMNAQKPLFNSESEAVL